MNTGTHPARVIAAVAAVIAAGTTTVMALTVGTATADELGRCTQNVNVREQPDTTSRIVATCKQGTVVALGTERDNFVRIDELGGWASKDYVTAGEATADADGPDAGAAADDASRDGSADDAAAGVEDAAQREDAPAGDDDAASTSASADEAGTDGADDRGAAGASQAGGEGTGGEGTGSEGADSADGTTAATATPAATPRRVGGIAGMFS
jgi:hypothetical protein